MAVLPIEDDNSLEASAAAARAITFAVCMVEVPAYGTKRRERVTGPAFVLGDGIRATTMQNVVLDARKDVENIGLRRAATSYGLDIIVEGNEKEGLLEDVGES